MNIVDAVVSKIGLENAYGFVHYKVKINHSIFLTFLGKYHKFILGPI